MGNTLSFAGEVLLDFTSLIILFHVVSDYIHTNPHCDQGTAKVAQTHILLSMK